MQHLNLIVAFIIAALVTWVAGVWLTRATDAIDTKYNLGSAFGGLLILGVITSLPEAAVTVTAALQHNYGIVIGTLIGGIAMQTVVLSLLDARMQLDRSLTFAAASLTLVLEAAFVILVTVAAIIAVRTPVAIPHFNFGITSVLILGLWLAGLWMVFKSRTGLPWQAKAIEATPGRAHHERRAVVNHPSFKNASTTKIYATLSLSSAAIVVAGYYLATTGSQIAEVYNVSAGLFAATFIALAGALPNISTGLASIKLEDYKLAMSDVFGGNAFMPALLIVADLLAGKAIIANASTTDIWFAAMGILLTGIYLVGLIVRPRRLFLRMGLDSILVLIVYIAGLVALSR